MSELEWSTTISLADGVANWRTATRKTALRGQYPPGSTFKIITTSAKFLSAFPG